MFTLTGKKTGRQNRQTGRTDQGEQKDGDRQAVGCLALCVLLTLLSSPSCLLSSPLSLSISSPLFRHIFQWDIYLYGENIGDRDWDGWDISPPLGCLLFLYSFLPPPSLPTLHALPCPCLSPLSLKQMFVGTVFLFLVGILGIFAWTRVPSSSTSQWWALGRLELITSGR